jgi:hypothetical protein
MTSIADDSSEYARYHRALNDARDALRQAKLALFRVMDFPTQYIDPACTDIQSCRHLFDLQFAHAATQLCRMEISYDINSRKDRESAEQKSGERVV